ncbi:MAG TPA: hypothetical protein VGR87_14775 [Candidatus Limnocylindria bacterium]|jgi:hypothetical protein|nr:hypothetical protein [Candidatus Limnocylindria bacterium]
MQQVKEEVREETLVAAFPDHESAVEAAVALDAAGVPPDHVGVVAENVRQAREAAGSFSAAGAIVGALVGALVAVVFVVAGGEAMQRNLVAILLGAPALIFAFAAIGAVAGRARLFQRRAYERYERAVERGEALVTVSGAPRELIRAREILEREGAIRLRHENTGEGI